MKFNHPEGPNAWIDIATKTSYVNLTYATSVKTSLALEVPFPEERVSENYHTWLSYSAKGDYFAYIPNTPTLYRIPQKMLSASRDREFDFMSQVAIVNKEGFKEALDIAIKNGKVDPKRKTELFVRYYVKSARVMHSSKRDDLAKVELNKAESYSKDLTRKYLEGTSLWDNYWEAKSVGLHRSKSLPNIKIQVET
jgi:hypothetical protein